MTTDDMFSEAALLEGLRLPVRAGQPIPGYMHKHLIRYIREGTGVGDFLRSVISNNLRAAVLRADDQNILALPAYAYFLYEYAPVACWGSKEKYAEWTRLKQEAAV